MYRQQSQHFVFQPSFQAASEAAPVLQSTFRVQRNPTFKQKVLEALRFLKGKMHILQNLRFQQVS